jgi:cob(I)alamin adenosyltransferase
MKIYTKKGDAGVTGLFGNVRVPKDDLRICTYGTFDELNTVLGMALSISEIQGTLRAQLGRVQSELFQLGAELATPRDKSSGIHLVDQNAIHMLESEIDAMEAKLAPLKNFILPGGSKASAFLHFARTVCRRGERELIGLNRAEPLRAEVLQYVNRMSDYLFVCARFANHLSATADVQWVPAKSVTKDESESGAV